MSPYPHSAVVVQVIEIVKGFWDKATFNRTYWILIGKYKLTYDHFGNISKK